VHAQLRVEPTANVARYDDLRQSVYSYGHVKTLTQRLMEEALTLLDAPTSSEGSLTQT
jgi:hypothetical protein